MKVIGISSSPRGDISRTLWLLKSVLNGARHGGADVDLVDVCRLKIEYCKACDVCHRTGSCVHHDDMAGLRAKILGADGIVLASPDYFHGISAQLKTVIDRMSDFAHCQLLAGKYAGSVATSGGPGGAEVADYLSKILLGFGAFVVGSVTGEPAKGPAAMKEAEGKALRLGRDLAAAITSRRVVSEQQAEHARTAAYFRQLVESNRERWPHEYQVWLEPETPITHYGPRQESPRKIPPK